MDFGPSRLENEDVVVPLDRILADLFKFIDKTVEFENTLIVLSADHGMTDMPRDLLWWKCFNSKFIMKIENRGILLDKKSPYSTLNSYSINCCKPKKEEKMKRTLITVVVMAAFLMTGASALAGQNDLVQIVQDGCKAEMDKYCAMVTPGEGRVLACLFSYQDKLSNRCEYALYDAAAQLERAVAALTYVVNECDNDLEEFCSNVAPGEGRLKECIDKNMAKVSDRCKRAMKDVGMK